MTKNAAIYCRISEDVARDGLGVARQEKDCRAEVARRGWSVQDVYVDNDKSAYNGKPRPAYGRMLQAVEAGLADVVVVYHIDRMTRDQLVFEQFVKIAERLHVDVITVVQDFDLGNSDGLLQARISAAFAAKASADTSRRVSRKMEELAESGKPHGGTRAFGYELGGMAVREGEAEIVREMSRRILRGETLASVTKWLQDTGVPTVNGGQWRTSTVKDSLCSGRIAGIREHRGKAVAEAAWPPIITGEEHQRLRRILRDPARRTNRTARSYLLHGLLRCWNCGQLLFAHPRSGRRRYICKSGVDFSGCGKPHIAADGAEAIVAQAVLAVLQSPEFLRGAYGKKGPGPEDTGHVIAQIGEAEARLVDLSEMWAAGELETVEWRAARSKLEGTLKGLKQRLQQRTTDTVLFPYLNGEKLQHADWTALPFDRKRAIVTALVDHVVVGPGQSGTQTVDPARLTIHWTA